MTRYSVKYWMRHKGRAATLFFTIFFCTLSMTVGVFIARSASQASVEAALTTSGNYDIVVSSIQDGQLSELKGRPDIEDAACILSGGSCKTEYSDAVPFGAIDGGRAEEMFYYPPEKGGRYPAKPGEVCAYRGVLKELGVAPVLGNAIDLELFDPQGRPLGVKSLVIVGILNEDDTRYGAARSLDGMFSCGAGGGLYSAELAADLPRVFLWKGDLPESREACALLRCKPDFAPFKVGSDIGGDGMLAWGSSARLDELGYYVQVEYSTEAELRERAGLTYRDFYSSALIPAFLAVVIAVSFLSIYSVMSSVLLDRQRQLGLERSMGLSLRRARRMLLAESAIFDVCGVACGYAGGVLAYAAYNAAINALGASRVPSAFSVHWAAEAISLSPYFWPWALSLLSAGAALAFSLIRNLRTSPNDMLFPERKRRGRRRARSEERGGAGRILPRLFGRILSGSAPVSLLIILTGWAFVFGCAFMMGKADSDSYALRQKMADAKGVGADYMASKRLDDATCGNVTFNRHDIGISREDMGLLEESADVADAVGVCRLPGLKVIYEGGQVPDEKRDALAPLDIDNNMIEENLAELYKKSKAAQGYGEDDLLYQVPATAVDDGFIAGLAPLVVSGSLDPGGLSDGSKVALVEFSDAGLKNPFSVGEMLRLTDAVISDPAIDSFDFSHNQMPSWLEPTFYYDYADKSATRQKGYSFGKKTVFEAQVCAILRVEDESLRDKLETKCFVMGDLGPDAPGYGILCSTSALGGWGLPDRLYTDAYVTLKRGADADRFETLWYGILGRSGGMENVSRADIRRSIQKKGQKNAALFASMALLVFLTGCFGMANSYGFAVRKSGRSLQALRAIGMSQRGMAALFARSLVRTPLAAVVTSVIPIEAFDLLRRYAERCLFTGDNNVATAAENGKIIWTWAARFPYYIKLWEQPVALIMLAALACMVALNVLAAVLPIRGLGKAAIADGVREEGF